MEAPKRRGRPRIIGCKPPPKKRGRKPRFAGETLERIIALRREGKNQVEIAEEFQVSRQRIWQVLKANGID